jgi:hypothetical protein
LNNDEQKMDFLHLHHKAEIRWFQEHFTKGMTSKCN